ncbi:DUF3017 domain-containing protein [Thermasporomyces composti]|jgi:hypothetical protein|uniref:DUF3017 family protein n=1 Tax=Thermasporomyces composti TaxID=696763 RepID=A0A3D9V7H3_THECX|nr:DUF3017 domain-containing protein [Thermasporomyces composti]REF37419.1 DUF3017 family protein [Thermasporomyces composti]
MVDQPGVASAGRTSRASGSARDGSAGGREPWWAFWKRGTHNPGQPLPPIRPWPRRQWPLLVVLTGVAISLVSAVVADFRPGMVMLAGSVLLAALFRLVLTTRRAGLLVLRSRTTDVLTLTAMGLGILVLALAIPDIR